MSGPTSSEIFATTHRALEGFDLCRPEHFTLHRYLEFLQTAELVTAGTAEAYLDVHREAFYGGEQPPAERVAAAAEALLAEIREHGQANSSALEAVAERLRQEKPKPLPRPQREAEPALPEPAQDEADEADEDGEDGLDHGDPEVATRQSRWSRISPGRRRIVVWVALVFWSAAMIATGIWHQQVTRQLYVLGSWMIFQRPPQPTPDQQLEVFRERARANPESTDVWLGYVRTLADSGYEAETAAAYQHLLVLMPENANILNGLAWLYCTAEDPKVRDPVQAMPLAERAYALDQSPAVTDTLAEAFYLRGDPERAVALERDALARLGENRNRTFYLNQLKKFEKAAEKAAED